MSHQQRDGGSLRAIRSIPPGAWSSSDKHLESVRKTGPKKGVWCSSQLPLNIHHCLCDSWRSKGANPGAISTSGWCFCCPSSPGGCTAPSLELVHLLSSHAVPTDTQIPPLPSSLPLTLRRCLTLGHRAVPVLCTVARGWHPWAQCHRVSPSRTVHKPLVESFA